MSKQGPLALIIVDGWGLAEKDLAGDAFHQAHTPYIDELFSHYNWTGLQATGLSVGLPTGQIGNSEVGHLNLGAGRIVYQDLTRINKALDEGEFYNNVVLRENLGKALDRNGAVHLLGLLSDGGVHSHIDHLKGILKVCKDCKLKEVYIHAILDGRDVLPQSATAFIKDIEEECQRIGLGKIATIGGRYYYMDRDNRWERIEKAYRGITLEDGLHAPSALQALEEGYKRGESDEFLLPTIVGDSYAGLNKGDLIFFYNFRADRSRQLTRAFSQEGFSFFPLAVPPSSLDIITMTEYDRTFNLPVLFEPEEIKDHLGEWLSKNGLKQLRLAETEKYAHVTFFFNGGREEQYPGEIRCLIPSPSVATYDLKPEMSAVEITDKALDYIKEGQIDVYIINYANFDMVGHTGNFKAALRAVETVDECLARLVPAILEEGGFVFLTSDHGNIEKMLDEEGGPFTAHTTNSVPFLACGIGGKRLRQDALLSDVAPTILQAMNLEIPGAMTGKSIILEG